MKVVRNKNESIDVQLGHWEMGQFLDLLTLYPCVPPAHQKVSRGGGSDESRTSSQALLEEALEEQRNHLRSTLKGFLADPARCQANARGGKLHLDPATLEWLLQVLNDIRVGSWIKAGSPESGSPSVSGGNARELWAMEMAGYFQISLLQAVDGEI